jgi:hypothetical protein
MDPIPQEKRDINTLSYGHMTKHVSNNNPGKDPATIKLFNKVLLKI